MSAKTLAAFPGHIESNLSFFVFLAFQFSVFNVHSSRAIARRLSKKAYVTPLRVFASQTYPPLSVQFLLGRNYKAQKLLSVSLKSFQWVVAKTSAIRARADATDSIQQFVRNAVTRRDRSMESASQHPELTRPPSTTRGVLATKPCLPDTCDSAAACPCSPARIGARTSG